jgi:hypothetical protein
MTHGDIRQRTTRKRRLMACRDRLRSPRINNPPPPLTALVRRHRMVPSSPVMFRPAKFCLVEDRLGWYQEALPVAFPP